MVQVPHSKSSGRAAAGWCMLALLATALPPVLTAQDLLRPVDGAVRLFTTDSAVLEAQDTRHDLPCVVVPSKPALGFDLKFHAGYEVSIGLKDLVGDGNQLTMIFRVTPEGRADDAAYLSQRVTVPMIDEDERGPAILDGAFDVGEGKYHVDWLMRDRAERICSAHWDAEASLPAKDRQMGLNIDPNAVSASDREPFKEEAPVSRSSGNGALNVKVMMNFAPQDAQSAALQPLDTNALLSILRSIAREPRIAKFSVVAYSMQERKVIYRQETAPQIDFPALGQAVKELNLGTVDLKHLSEKHGDTEFLGHLIEHEVKNGLEKPDAVIFAGPKVVLDDSIPIETLRQLGDVKYPVFYMNYNLYPQVNPWRDAIGNTVRYLKGAEYTITRPRDLFFAWTEIIGRIVKSKFGSTATASASGQ